MYFFIFLFLAFVPQTAHASDFKLLAVFESVSVFSPEPLMKGWRPPFTLDPLLFLLLNTLLHISIHVCDVRIVNEHLT